MEYKTLVENLSKDKQKIVRSGELSAAIGQAVVGYFSLLIASADGLDSEYSRLSKNPPKVPHLDRIRLNRIYMIMRDGFETKAMPGQGAYDITDRFAVVQDPLARDFLHFLLLARLKWKGKVLNSDGTFRADLPGDFDLLKKQSLQEASRMMSELKIADGYTAQELTHEGVFTAIFESQLTLPGIAHKNMTLSNRPPQSR